MGPVRLNDWSAGTTVVAASGPSITVEQLEFCRGRAHVLVINNTHELAPWADAIYACDAEWWDHYGPTVRIAERWSMVPKGNPGGWSLPARQKAAGERWGLKLIPGGPGQGLGLDCIHYGSNSGYQAINLAFLFGARRIVLLGYDFQNTGGRKHWHPDHPDGMNKNNNFTAWGRKFVPLVADLNQHGVTILNASAQTALAAVPRISLEQALEDCDASDRAA